MRQITFKGKSTPTLELPPAEILLSPLSRADRSVAQAKAHKISIVQEAERRLFEPRADGLCRASESQRFQKLMGDKKPGSMRRRSEQDSPDLVRGGRARFASVADIHSHASLSAHSTPPLSRASSSSSNAVSAVMAKDSSANSRRPPSPKISRSRFLSIDHRIVLGKVSPVLESEPTPRIGAGEDQGSSPFLADQTPRLPPSNERPFTPPSEHDPPMPSSDLFKSFAGFAFETTSTPELSPPSTPQRGSRQHTRRGLGPTERSPSSSSIVKIDVAAASQPGVEPAMSSAPLPLLKVQSVESDVTDGMSRRRSSLSRFFGGEGFLRRPSRSH